MIAEVLGSAGFFLGAFIAFLTIMNPFSTASIFLTITQNDSRKKRILIAKKACVTAAIVLILFALGGTLILNFFSVTVDAFRIAGGLLITSVGQGMLKSKRPYRKDIHEDEAIEKDDVSLIPLAIPMLSGPGAMTTAIVLMGEAKLSISIWPSVLAVVLAIIVTCIVSYIVLQQSLRLQKFISHNEQIVIEKIMGLIVLVIGIQFFINGVVGVLTAHFG